MNRNRNTPAAGPQPQYRDGKRPWAVDAVRVGSTPQTYTTIYVDAFTAEDARDAGVHMLRVMMRGRGQPRGWVASARPATCGELGMVPINDHTKETT